MTTVQYEDIEKLLEINNVDDFYRNWKKYFDEALEKNNLNKVDKLFDIIIQYLKKYYKVIDYHLNGYTSEIRTFICDYNTINFMNIDFIKELYDLFKKYQPNKFDEIQTVYCNFILEFIKLTNCTTDYLTEIYIKKLFVDNNLKIIVGDKHYNDKLDIFFYIYLSSFKIHLPDDFYFIYYYEEIINKSKISTKYIKLRPLLQYIKNTFNLEFNTALSICVAMEIGDVQSNKLPNIAKDYFKDELKIIEEEENQNIEKYIEIKTKYNAL